jgi:outer membrane cobalamin receptor
MRLSRWVLVCVPMLADRAGADDLSPTTDLGGVKDITEVSLDDLLKTDIDVASKIPQTLRETPGVISVITREEIMDSGARDLEDVLLLVPGFTLGVDVEGITDVGVRGNWGHEGKVLLLIDGQQMNETLYSTNQLGNHYPIDQVERIEIIRGPGSAIYGGYAELAVINVITRGPEQLQNGIAMYGNGGFMKHAASNATFSIASGGKEGPLAVSVSALVGTGHRSDATFTDFFGSTYSLEDHKLEPTFLNIGVKYNALSARFIYDNYRTDEHDGLGENEVHNVEQRFIGMYSELKYDAKPNAKLTVTPKLNYTRQLPWNIRDPESGSFYDKTAERFTGGASASYDVKKGVNILGGAEVYWDHAFLNQPFVPDTTQTQFGDKDEITYYNEAVYAQALWNQKIANITVGARYEHHSEFGNSFVPRIALTKVFEPFHVKLLYSEAFRAPGFEDINLAPSPDRPVKPEHTRVGEAEFGYAIGAHNFATLNVFYTRISDPIVYFVNEDATEGYANFDHTTTAGVEAGYKARYAWGYVDVNYSYYRALSNSVPLYAVADHKDVLFGMPAHKLALHGAYKVWKGLRIAPTVIALSGAYGALLPGDGMGVGTYGQADSTLLVNVFATYQNLFIKGLEAGVGGRNLLDDKFLYLQPYDAGHAPMQGATRELLLRVGLTRSF